MPAPNPMSQMLMIGGFVVIFYFLLWRPQNKRAKAHRQLIDGLNKGDEVVTTGGLLGKIVRIKDGFLVLTIADGTEIKIQKQAVVSALPKGTLKAI